MSEWYYAQDDKQLGPVAWEQLQQLAATKKLRPADLVWKEGMANWVPACSVPKLMVSSTPKPPQLPPKFNPQPNEATPDDVDEVVSVTSAGSFLSKDNLTKEVEVPGLKKRIPMWAVLAAPLGSLFLCCGGCAVLVSAMSGWTTAKVEETAKTLIEKKEAVTLKEVQLIKEAPNKYSGYATTTFGEQYKVDVTVDGEELMVRWSKP